MSEKQYLILSPTITIKNTYEEILPDGKYNVTYTECAKGKINDYIKEIRELYRKEITEHTKNENEVYNVDVSYNNCHFMILENKFYELMIKLKQESTSFIIIGHYFTFDKRDNFTKNDLHIQISIYHSESRYVPQIHKYRILFIQVYSEVPDNYFIDKSQQRIK